MEGVSLPPAANVTHRLNFFCGRPKKVFQGGARGMSFNRDSMAIPAHAGSRAATAERP
jgi:hypothetical protein